jgi:hypothetical protein
MEKKKWFKIADFWVCSFFDGSDWLFQNTFFVFGLPRNWNEKTRIRYLQWNSVITVFVLTHLPEAQDK